MKIREYKQMMDYLTGPREGFSNGGKVGANQFTGPGKLRQDIVNAYKTLNKGAATTTEDIYNYLTKKKNYKKNRDLLKRNIALNLNRENLKFSKDLKKELRSETQYLRRKTAKVDIPTPVYEKGSASTVIEEVLFPEKGPRSKKNFVKDITKYFSLPKEDALLTKERNKIIKKYFPNGISKSKFQNLYNFVAEKENIDTTRPLKFTDKTEKGRAEYERTKKFQKEFSDVKKEGAFKKAKKGSGLDLAHKLSKETSMRFGLQQTTGTQGIQKPVINQAIIKQYEKRLDVLYDLQQELMKSKPKDVAKKLELINRMVTSVVEDSGNRIVGVVIDEKTLQPRLYGNLSGARDTIDSGVFNKKIKNLTQNDMDFITKVLIPQSIENQAIIGSDLSGMKNIDKNELIKSLKKSKKVSKPIIKEAENLIKQFPEVTKPTGPLGLDVKKQDILVKYLGALGCPDKFGKFSTGGRIGFQQGTVPTQACIIKGANVVNQGNVKNLSQAQRINLERFLKLGYRGLRTVMKFGVIPEAIFIAGESLFRVGMGDTFDEAFKRSIDYFVKGDKTAEAQASKIARTIGKNEANLFKDVADFRNAQKNFKTAKSNLETNQAVLDGSGFGYTANIDGISQQEIDERKIKEAKKELFLKKVSPDAITLADYLSDKADDISKSKNFFTKAFAKQKEFAQTLAPVTDESGLNFDLNYYTGFNTKPVEVFPNFRDTALRDPDQIIKDVNTSYRAGEFGPVGLESSRDAAAKDAFEDIREFDFTKTASLNELADKYGVEQIFGANPENQLQKILPPGASFSPQLQGSFAGGGIAGLSGGIDKGPQVKSMNPDSGGLAFFQNNVKKL